VPDVTNLSVDEATAKLQAAGLTVSSTTTEIHPTIGKGLVIRTQPAANTQVSRGTPIALAVSRGTGQRQITVTFTQAYIHNDGDDWTRGMGEIWFNFNVNGQTGRWPASGTRDLDGGHAYAINLTLVVVIPENGTLSIFVKGTEDDSPDSNDDMGTVSQEYFSDSNWGQGAHSTRSTCPDGCYTMYYAISVTELP
jgi:outer membrane protein assembly factor BamA